MLRRLWRDHSILIVLIGLLLIALVVAWVLGIGEWQEEQKHLGGSLALWPGYWRHYAYDVIVSILADIWGPALVIGLGLRWYDRKSHESGTT